MTEEFVCPTWVNRVTELAPDIFAKFVIVPDAARMDYAPVVTLEEER